jgi:hypothetical protein
MSPKSALQALREFVADDKSGEAEVDEFVAKRPAGKQVMKKPSAKVAKDSKQLKGKPEASTDDAHDAGEDAEHRDRLKSLAFHRNLNNMPPEIRGEWTRLMTAAGSKRKAQTALINGVMKRNKTGGGWDIDRDAPILEELRKREKSKWSQHLEKALPKSLMVGKAMGLQQGRT